MATVKEFVDGKIASKKVMVFSKTHCPFCHKAKAVLADYVKSGELSSEDYEVLEMENRPDCSGLQDYLRSITGARSVPRVFINGKCIGGGDETAAAHRSGKLSAMLKA